MKLRGRELSLRMDPATGPDVELLHDELSRLGPRYVELVRIDSVAGSSRFGQATARAVGLFQRERGLQATGVVDDETAAAINAAVHALDPAPQPAPPDRPVAVPPNGGTPDQPADFQHLVRGQVRYEDGLPIPGLIVRAVDRRLKGDDPLGKEVRTDAEGLYEIFYSPDELRGENRRYATLIVRAFDTADGHETLVAESDIVPDAQVVEKVNLRVAGGLAHVWSEYEQIMSEVTPLLEGAELASLTEDAERGEISYLSARLHRPPAQLAQLVGAHRLAAKTLLPPEVFYGLVRMQLPIGLAELTSQSPARLSRALRAAITNRVVPGKLADSLDKIVARLHALVPEIAAGHAAAGATPVGAVLAAAGVPGDLQTRLVEQFVSHAGPVKGFWKTLRAQPEFAGHVDDVGFGFQAAAISGNHLSLVSELLRERAAGRLRTARDLSRYTAADWQELLGRANGNAGAQIPPTIKGANEKERAANYARKLEATVTRAYPIETLAQRVVASNRESRDVRMFFKNVLDAEKPIDLATISFDGLAKSHPELLQNIGDGPALMSTLRTMQRVYRVEPRYEAMTALMSAGFTSALRINQSGRQFFARTMSGSVGGSVEALKIWDRASLVTAAALNVMANAGPWLNDIDMHVLPWKKPATIAGASWESLFGTPDVCDCSDCQSVVSPSAYFAELLAFLKERTHTKDLGGGVNQASNARDILFERRADLGNIELTCPNTNTEMPYIDLVNEVLEAAIAPFVPFAPLPAGTIADLDARTLSPAITGAFTAAAAVIEPGALIQVVKAGESWFVSDRRRLYVIKKDGGQPKVTAVGLQTFGKTNELLAAPNHTNTAAYTTLAAAVFPWSLPLDLTIEEMRRWIKAAGASRAGLMETFRPIGAPFDPDDDAIAAERLGLTPAQRDLVVGATAHQPWELWGLAQNNNAVVVPKAADLSQDEEQHVGWIDALTHVRVFLARSGCSYDELLQLLLTRFLNPAGAIRITSMDPQDAATCDTRKLIITPLDAATLVRVQGFVRLWRALGWTIREVDLAIGVLRAAEADVNKRLNLALISQLASLKTLAAEHPADIDELLTLWGPIDTTGDGSLWARRFLSPSVSKPADPAFLLKDDGSEVATANLKISDHLPAVLAGLGAEATELADLQAVEVPANDLTVANVSALFRRVVLARALGIGVRDLLQWRQIGGFDLFDAAHPEDVLAFANAIFACARARFTVSDVDFLLRHNASPDFSIADVVAGAAIVLTDIRAGLATIRENVSMDEGASDDLARKFLAMLKWDAAQVELVVTALNTTPSFTAPLDGLPAAFAFPATVAGRVGNDDRRRMLTFAGVISAADVAALQGAVVPAAIQPEYTKAVQALAAQSDALLNATKAYEFPEFRAALAAMPAGLKLPRRLKSRTYYDRKAAQLCFRGYMLAQDAQELKLLPGADVPFIAAVDALAQQSAAFAPAGDNVFLTAADLAAMLPGNVTPLTRFEQLLDKLLPRLRRLLSVDLIREKIADGLGADALVVGALVDTAALNGLMAPDFAESAPALSVESDRFPAAFDAYLRIAKGAMVATRLSLSPRMLDWYRRLRPAAPARDASWRHPAVQGGWLDIVNLPLAANAAADPARMVGLLRLLTLCGLRDRLRPAGEQALQEVFDAARDAALAGNAAALTAKVASILSLRAHWDEAGVTALLGAAGLNPALPADLRDETAIGRLEPAFGYAKRLNASVARCRSWAVSVPPPSVAADIRNALRARVGDEAWVDFAHPVQDGIRSRKRNALVDYLLINPPSITMPGGAVQPAWADVNGIFAHFLIDVEMEPCMTTSRLKQAIGSVQLFVQRALLNLEPFVRADATVDDAWNDWKWMYSITPWHANKMIFLMTENWADMTTLDQKTPLFRQLETDLQQTSLTDETAEDAFLKYLEGLDGIAKLDVIGEYEQENADGMRSVLHVFGRTPGTPHIYYYRRQESTGRWSPWEKVDVDIEGEHLIPLIWNRRLYLFWPLFKVKAQESVPAKDSGGSSPTKYFDIQMAWSEYRRGRWTPKRVSSVNVRSGVQWHDPESNNGDDGRNDHAFFYSIDADGLRIWPEWDNPSTTYSQLIEDTYGTITVPYLDPSAYVDTFFFSGCNSDAVIEGGRRIYGVFNPTGTGVRATSFEERNGMVIVYDLQGGAIVTGTTDDLYLPGDPSATKEEIALKQTPGNVRFRLAYPLQDRFLNGRRPFFFEDGAHAYAVYPQALTWNRLFWREVDQIDLGRFDRVIAATYGVKALKSGVIGAAPALVGAGGGLVGGVPAVAGPAAAVGGGALEVRQALETTTFPGGAFGGTTAPRLSMSALQRLRKADTIDAVAKYTSPAKLFTPPYAVPVFRRSLRYTFRNFAHPYACFFIHELKRGGVDTLMRLEVQESRSEYFASFYKPTSLVDPDFPVDEVDFIPGGAYSQYNWELFFYAPFLIATRLMTNQKFDDARRWFHYIFDPTDKSADDAPMKFWRFKPFHDLQRDDYYKQRMDQLLAPNASGGPNPQLVQQLDEWRRNPFSPHAVARLRVNAYQRTIVMRYLDNLIAWADMLFRQETIEAINQATELYVLAANILGPAPRRMKPRAEPQIQTYNSLDPSLDNFSDTLVEIESLVPSPSPDAVISKGGTPPLPIPRVPYFCIPRNATLLQYWATIDDRLTKIRHCQNIDGVKRTLRLWEPNVDPGLLARASAAGADIGSVLADLNAPLPYYRFTTVVQKASELVGEVRNLGAALLSALEKRDAEALSQLRSSQEIAVLDAVNKVKKTQVDEAVASVTALTNGRAMVNARYEYYKNIKKITANEQLSLDKAHAAREKETIAQVLEITASVLPLIGDFDIGASGWAASPVVKWRWGGMNLGIAAQSAARVMSLLASIDTYDSRVAESSARSDRQWDEWKQQEKVAKLELDQIDAQINAAKARQTVAETERDNHDLQKENARAADEMLRTKFTNRELYDWMVTQLSAVYFQAYQLAYDRCKQAERCSRHELGLKDSSFIQFGSWDDLRQGLLAGERLMLDVHRMEAAYLDQNRREFEITKHVSLALLNPTAVLALRTTGSCFFDLPEALFDVDQPGQYMRRIKSVSLTLPCVAGPYVGINAKVTLLSNRTRRDPQTKADYAWTGSDDPRFAYDIGGIQSIVTSTAREDNGLFELNFRDERYLPFEGAGAISTWRLELPAALRQFDYDTIADVVLHVRYTARDGGDALRDVVSNRLVAALNAMQVEQGRSGLFRLMNLRTDFGDEWHRFFYGAIGDDPPAMTFDLSSARFAPLGDTAAIKVQKVALLLKPARGVQYDPQDPVTYDVKPPGKPKVTLEVQALPGDLAVAAPGALDFGAGLAAPDDPAAAQWRFELGDVPAALRTVVNGPNGPIDMLDPTRVAEIGLLVKYVVA